MNSKNLILKNIIDTEPVLGAGAPTNSQVVRFAFTSNPESIASGADGQIVFAHIPALGTGKSTGVIYVGDQIVSSKILDASFVDAPIDGAKKDDVSTYLYNNGLYYTDAETKPEGASKVAKQIFTVQYVNDTSAIVTASFDNVNPELAQAFVKAQAAADKKRLDALDASVSGIETFIKGDVVTAASGTTNAAVVTASTDANGYKSYTVDVKVDNTTIQIDSTSKAIKALKSLAIVDGATGGNEEGKKFIILKNAAEQEESRIDVADLIGSGIVTSATYNPADNKLRIVWATATGDQDTVIDLADLLDINDVFVKPGSEDYLAITADTSVLNVSVKIADISTAANNSTGLLDAYQTKTWIETQITDTSIYAQGDAYVVATVDPEVNKKKVNVSTNVANLTYGEATASSHATLTGTANTLVDGSQAATAISNFVNGRLDASISALDAEQGGKDVNVSVGVTEVDGKITDVSIKETYATVTYTAPQTEGTPSPATLVVTGETGGLVTGADINKVKQYVDAQLGAEDATINLKEKESGNYVSVTIAELDGKLDQASSSLSVTYADYTNNTAGIATDAYVTDAINALDVSTSESNSSTADTNGFVKVTASETNGKIKMEEVIVKTSAIAAATAENSGLATAYAVKQALTWEILGNE